jgi:hypothetical protein
MPDPEDRDQLAPSTVNILVCAFAAGSTVFRLFPLIPNLAPVGALSLFAGSRVRGWRAYLVPVAVMVVSDLGLYWRKGEAPFNPFVYGAFLLTVLLGAGALRKLAAVKVSGATLVSSLLFFGITNFGCWLGMPDYYDRSLAGLADCYVKAIPFYGWTWVGDLAFSTLFFGVYALAASRRFAAAKEAA